MSRTFRVPLTALAALGLLTSSAVAQQPTPARIGPAPLSSAIQWHTEPSGLKWADMVVGQGPSPREGQVAVMHFTGWLPDNTQFDSSRTRKPFGFPVGSGQVIKGWDEGVRTMKVGGKRRLIVPGNLAYGPKGLRNIIPPDATLVFDIELVRIVDPPPAAK
ncbi:MAG: FKBP-type peptidyl-prolyl cis-trans isomerase [Candidatus Binatia bacterium]